jgi:hypothetical protein
MSMTKRTMIASAFAVAAVLAGGAGAVAAAHALAGPAASGWAVAPADHRDQPGVADQPDQPGVTQTPEPEDGPGGPDEVNEGPGE